MRIGRIKIDKELADLSLDASLELDNIRLGKSKEVKSINQLSQVLFREFPYVFESFLDDRLNCKLLWLLYRTFKFIWDRYKIATCVVNVSDVCREIITYANKLKDCADKIEYDEGMLQFCLALSRVSSSLSLEGLPRYADYHL